MKKNCCCKECCCSEEHESCYGSCHEQEEENKEEFLLELADCAWSEVLKDKIKEYILSTQNERMTELAKIVAEGNAKRWKHKMQSQKCCEEFKERLCNFFSQHHD